MRKEDGGARACQVKHRSIDSLIGCVCVGSIEMFTKLAGTLAFQPVCAGFVQPLGQPPRAPVGAPFRAAEQEKV